MRNHITRVKEIRAPVRLEERLNVITVAVNLIFIGID